MLRHSQRKHLLRSLILVCAACVLAGCAPMILITNNADFGVSVLVTSKGFQQVVSLAPGDETAVEVDEGAYGVYVFPGRKWIEFARSKRQEIVMVLEYPVDLSPVEIVEVLAQLDGISERIKQLEAQAEGVACSGNVTSDGGGVVNVDSDPNAVITVSCD